MVTALSKLRETECWQRTRPYLVHQPLALYPVCATRSEVDLSDSDMDDAASHRDGNRLCPVTRAKLLHNPAHMYFDIVLSDRQGQSDVPIPVATGQLRQHLQLTDA